MMIWSSLRLTFNAVFYGFLRFAQCRTTNHKKAGEEKEETKPRRLSTGVHRTPYVPGITVHIYLTTKIQKSYIIRPKGSLGLSFLPIYHV